jgi:hypothetical protein
MRSSPFALRLALQQQQQQQQQGGLVVVLAPQRQQGLLFQLTVVCVAATAAGLKAQCQRSSRSRCG